MTILIVIVLKYSYFIDMGYCNYMILVPKEIVECGHQAIYKYALSIGNQYVVKNQPEYEITKTQDELKLEYQNNLNKNVDDCDQYLSWMDYATSGCQLRLDSEGNGVERVNSEYDSWINPYLNTLSSDLLSFSKYVGHYGGVTIIDHLKVRHTIITLEQLHEYANNHQIRNDSVILACHNW